jgi:hypothetical protein
MFDDGRCLWGRFEDYSIASKKRGEQRIDEYEIGILEL